MDAPAPALVTASVAGSSGCGVGAEVLAVAPAWGSPILLPRPYQEAAADVAAGATSGPSFSVFLSTPLGPAKADIGSQQLAEAYRDGRRPVTVEAQLLLPDSDAAVTATAEQLRVLLQAGVERGKAGTEGDVPSEAVRCWGLCGMWWHSAGAGGIQGGQASGAALHSTCSTHFCCACTLLRCVLPLWCTGLPCAAELLG